MLITCKGVKKNNLLERCPFLYDGNWDDLPLIEHQKFHKSLENEKYSWLGFDTPQSIGVFSGRDGKQN